LASRIESDGFTEVVEFTPTMRTLIEEFAETLIRQLDEAEAA
jgi:hypothetical protein